MPIAIDVPERGRPETTTIGAPKGRAAKACERCGGTAPMIATPVRHIRVLAFPAAIAAGVLLASPATADAYIGPGAGFALFSSFFVFVTTVVIALLSLLVWPFRRLWRLLHRTKRGRPLIRRLIIVGFDGQDP